MLHVTDVAGMSAQTTLLFGMHVARTCTIDHHGRGVAVLALSTVRQSERFLHRIVQFVQDAASVIRNSDDVRYSGAAITLYIWTLQLVHMAVSVIGYRCPQLGVSVNGESTVNIHQTFKL